MITGDMPIDMVYDIDYDGVLTIMDLLIVSDISDDAVDSPYDCLD